MSADSRSADSTPASISRYQIVERLAAGPEGEVYRAFDPMIERPVAVKLLHLTFGDPTREAHIKIVFYREMQRAGRLIHPLITTLFDAGEVLQGLFVATEFVDGPNVAQLVAESPGMDLPARMTLVGQLVDALQYAHRNGVTHLNIKPTNLLVAPQLALKVAGFGLTHVLDAYQHEEPSSPLWLSPYAAPERIRGQEGSAAADMYSLAAVTLEILTGVPPFACPPSELLERIERNGPTRPERLAELGLDESAWADVFLRGMAKEPDDRFPTAGGFLATLASVLGVSRPDASHIWSRSTRVAIAGLSSGQVRQMDAAATEDGSPGIADDRPGEAGTWLDTVQDSTESLESEELRRESEAHPDFETTALAQKIAIQAAPAAEVAESPATTPAASEAPPVQAATTKAVKPVPAVRSSGATGSSRRWIAAVAAIVLVALAGAGAGLGYRWLSAKRAQVADAGAMESTAAADTEADSAAPVSDAAMDPNALSVPSEQAAGDLAAAPIAAPAAAPAGPIGSLRVVTTPVGATVTVDGAVRGTSPLRLRNLTLAEHTIGISMDGFEPAEQRVRLTGRKAAQVVDLTLRPAHVAPTLGSVTITTDPPGASVTVDGSAVDTSGSINLPPGRHSIRAVLDGHEPASRDVDVEAGGTAQVSLRLTPVVAPPTGPLDLARVEVKPRQVAGGSAPGYPRAARQLRLSGFVVASWTVDERGAVTDATIDQASSKVFETEVLHWLKDVRYLPGRQAGQAVKVRMQRRFAFEYAREH